MAIARAQVAGGSGGLKVATIVFAVLTVVSLAFTIILVTKQSELEQKADSAERQRRTAQDSARQAGQDLRTLARTVTGTEHEQLAAITDAITRDTGTSIQLLESKEVQVRVADDISVLALLEEVREALKKKIQALADMAQERDGLKVELANKTAEADAKAAELASYMADLDSRYDALNQDKTTFQEKANERIAELEARRGAEMAAVEAMRAEEQALREEREKELQRERNRNAELTAQLAAFRTTGAEGSILQIKDGEIVRLVPTSDVVYVNLGRRDGVKPGMTFSVYSAVDGIPFDGKGKGAIEITNPFEITSECRVLMRTRGRPILPNDIIANPVFDKTKQFRFAVVGDFDLDFDGVIEDPGGRRVAALIEHSGGKVVDSVDTRTDFVVLGAPPLAPGAMRPGGAKETAEAEPGTAEAAEESEERASEATRVEDRAQAKQRFETARREASSLSIPILTRTQFLHYMGLAVPKNMPDDQLAM